jgi:hypothetical protein
METAKVDIRKLQTLTDCINRTIEALNQVRLSVHGGLAHSAQMGLQGVGTPAFFGGFPGNFPGAFTSPFGIPQQVAGMVPNFANVAALTGGFPNAFAQGAGLGHTQFDPRFGQVGQFGQIDPRFGWDFTADPYATARVGQTFPFVQWGQSPFGWQNV